VYKTKYFTLKYYSVLAQGLSTELESALVAAQTLCAFMLLKDFCVICRFCCDDASEPVGTFYRPIRNKSF
jgi:hypothetical protein